MLKKTFIELAGHFTTDVSLVEETWSEIETAYSNKRRHYHTLNHLENLLNQLIENKNEISDWHAILFSLYFHDIIYTVLKTNNEEKSARVAEIKMTALTVPKEIIERCKGHINATKVHATSADPDTNIFTDADLSILGAPWQTYVQYCKCVRKEYLLYPDFMYNPGRKKVLIHFLQMPKIFKIGYFFENFEVQARKNLQQEFDTLL